MAENESLSGLEIAVIGMAGRFPAAGNIHEYWHNIKKGIECVAFYSEEELEKAGISPGLYNHPDYIKSNGGIFEGAEYFDADFFGYTPTEAELLDPQLRLFQECCWEALEDAGYDPSAYKGLIGLFGGAEDNNPWREKVLLSTADAEAKQTRILLSSKDFVTARAAYKMDLKGPVFTLITGCSTALTSIHLASRSLIGGECNIALAGGAYIHLLGGMGRIYREGMLESSDGHLRAFDTRASGTIFSSGVGIVALKILEDALADNDHIYAVIKGSAVNCDGKSKVNFTAPSVKGQVNVIKAAYKAADVEMETIGYLETHGTGTPLGDPIEINALRQAFKTKPGWRCPIGSVKTNIGHLDVAAGAAGFIKTVLVLKHKLIPPSLNFETPNPKLELEKTPFYVNTGLTELRNNGGPRRAAVSSFGFGGTNAHVILEEAPEGTGGLAPLPGEEISAQSQGYQLILLSAKTPSALDKMTQNLVDYFKNSLLNHGNHKNPVNPDQNPGLTLANAAYTLQVGRQPFPYRKFCVCANPGEAVHDLPASPPAQAGKHPPVVFMFSGQGSQYVNMGREIYHSQPVFREHMDNGFNILKSLTGKDFKAIFYPEPDTVDIDNIRQQMNDVHNSGPIKLIFEYSLGKLLIHWGIRPHALMGHSFGEYTAACLAGVFSLGDALELALLRGELMLRTPAGGMMSIPLGQVQLSLYLETHPNISLAAVNSSSLCFVSGPPGALEDLEIDLQEKDVECMRINFPRAAHSYMMKFITHEFEKKVRTIKLHEPTIPFISGLTGDWLSPGQITEPGYWTKHLEQPVLFCQGVEKLLKEPGCIFVQVGPDKGLPLFVNRHRRFKPGTLVTNLVKHKKDNVPDMVYLLQQVGTLWLQGVRIHWPAFYANRQRQRISLPTYPFEGKRYWIDIDLSTIVSDFFFRGLLKKRENIPGWLYTSSWKRAPLVPAPTGTTRESTPCLIFTDAGELGASLAARLEQKGNTVIMVKPGQGFKQENHRVYRINPTKGSDYDRLFKALNTQKKIPRLLMHLWNVTGTKAPGLTAAALDTILDPGLYSLLNLVQSLGRSGINEEMHLEVITDNMQAVIGENILYPAKATILGAVRVIPQEYPHISCHALDIILPEPGTPGEEELLQQLLTVVTREPFDKTNQVMALRGNRTWTQSYEPIPMEKPRGPSARLKQGGVYLITGGLGGIGYVLAEYLVKTVKARLILTGRTQLPAKDQWQQWLDAHPDEDPVSKRIRKVIDLEKQGAKVLVFSANTADKKQMQEVVTRAAEHFQQVNGIIHTAGLVDYNGVIQNRTREMTESILAPKVKGTVILDELTRDMPLDFFVICSSIASLIPAFGEVGYAAANMFIDAFVHDKNLTGKPFFTGVNWDTWQEVGAAVESVRKQEQAGKTSYIRLEDGIRPTEGCEVFNMVLENPNPQVVVSTKDLELLLKQYHHAGTETKAGPGETAEATGKGPKKSLKPRPKLSTPYMTPANPTQQTLAQIWQDYFGIDRVGIQDDFFELGGDSLMATIMTTRIHKQMNIRIPLTEIFQGPTVEQLSRYIKGQEEEKFESVPLVEKRDYYPLSPAQKRLFILQQLEAGLISYNSPDFFILEGELDKERLNQSLGQMIRRHDSLRTTFEMAAGEPVQRIAHRIDSEIEYYTGKEEQARVVVKDFVRPFDLRSAPLLRVGLIKIREDRYIYMFDMHHIITDGISLEIFANEFLALYEGKQLAPLSVQYKDFSQWQNHLLESGEIKKQEQYWLEEFAGEIPLLDLPTDYPRPEAQSFAGRKYQVQLSPGDTQGLKRLSREQDVTLYMTTLAVIKVLFSRLSNQETIIMGTITAGRQHEDLQHIIGMFVNTLVLKSHPAGDKTFIQYLQELKQKSLAAFENQDYPFEELVSKLNLDRHMNRNPLFDVMFSFQNFEAPEIETSPPSSRSTARSTSQLSKKAYAFEDLAARFDITLFVTETADSLLFKFEYCTKLFKPETMERLGNYIKEIVAAIIDNPGIRLGNIEIITAEEKQRILYEFNNTERDYPREMTIHELFASQVQRTPDHTAVIGIQPGARSMEKHLEGTKRLAPLYMTYRELNRNSHQLACCLQEKGIRHDTIAAIMIKRSIEMIIGILGILTAGGAYLPIDPGYPEERINYILADSGAEILLTTTGLSKKVKYKKEVVHVTEAINHVPTPLHPDLPPTPVTSLAYIIYTSGSTGNPKGVEVEHRSVVNRLNWMQRFYPIGKDDALLQKTPISFDVSVWELFWWSFQGARLYLLAPGAEKIPAAIISAAANNKITTIHFVPSMLNVFLESLETSVNRDINKLSHLRQVFASGEALSAYQVQKFNRLLNKPNKTKLINLYGPTEATVDVSYFNCPPVEEQENISIPIGKPIDNIRLYIVNTAMRLQTIGVVGELCIAGVGLARGYLNRPQLTAEKFVQNPLVPSEKMYKTGDLTRWLPDGNIEFLGRKDHQVKIRGFRIELEEIENRLADHKEIKEAIVISREENHQDRYLCAYFVSDKDLTVPQLRNYLSLHLPNHMIPSFFIQLEHIPLTLQGKVDRRALPIPKEIRPRLEVTYVAPESDLEKTLTQIWGEVIKRDKVGIHDNFFELGGTSLDIVKVNGKLRELLNIDAPEVAIFRYPTISGFARYLERVTVQNIDMDRISKAARKEALRKGENRKMSQSRARKSARENYSIKRGSV
ncbi:MAG: amino acid adenylation domain-containing protein [Candidatus Aminicenantes bacterium]|jgi:amino acid adenylation domain-containing protein